MKKSLYVLIAGISTVLLFPTPLFANELANCPAFTRNLRLGMEGEDVRTLQLLLNQDMSTLIARTGPGSPGNESRYFGEKTKNAVLRFQEYYASDVLVPAGLSKGNGFIGPYSRIKLLKICTDHLARVKQGELPVTQEKVSATTSQNNNRVISLLTVPPPGVQSETGTLADVIKNINSSSSTPLPFTPLSPNMKVPEGVNPNTINLEYSLGIIRSSLQKNGLNEVEIERNIAEIRNVLATSTNLTKEFFRRNTFTAINTTDVGLAGVPFSQLFSSIFSFVTGAKTADAQMAGVPFGGLIATTFPCTCTGGTVWYVVNGLLVGPTYVATLSAMPGAQMFLSYNIPMVGVYMLGFYQPGLQQCFMYYGITCGPLPTEGAILPFVGSSAL